MNWFFFNGFHRKNTENTTDNTEERNMSTCEVRSTKYEVRSAVAFRAVKNEKRCAMKSNFWKNAAMWLVAAGTLLGSAGVAGAATYLKGGFNSWGTGNSMSWDFGGFVCTYKATGASTDGTSYEFKYDDNGTWYGLGQNISAAQVNTTVRSVGSGGNMTVVLKKDKHYTFKFDKSNQMVMMTTGNPVTITGASGPGNDGCSAAGVAATVTITLSSETVPDEQKFYVRYSTDGGSTWSLSSAGTGTGNQRTISIPASANTAGSTVQYYILSSSVTSTTTIKNNADLCTICGYKNGSDNYSYRVSQTVYYRQASDNNSGGLWWFDDNNGQKQPWWYNTEGAQHEVPDNSGSANDLVYNTSNDQTQKLNGKWFKVNSITFETSATARTFQKNNSSEDVGIDLYNGIDNKVNALQTFQVPVSIKKAGTLYARTGNMTFQGNLYLDADVTLQAGNSKTLTVSGAISKSGNITKTGGATVVLSGNNSYTGTTEVNQGTLKITSATALGDASAGTTVTDATLELGPSAAITVDELLTLDGATVKNSAQANTLGGDVTLDGDSKINVTGGSLTMSGDIGGTGSGLEKTGSQQLTLSGANTYSGGTTVSAGTLKLTGSLSSSDVTVSGGTLESGGSAKSVKSITMASGTLKTSTANTFSGSGAANITGGTIAFDASGWTKTGLTKSWTIYSGGAAATCSGITKSITAATGTSASEYTIAASGNNIVVTWTAPISAPTVSDSGASSVTATSATVGASVNAGGDSTTVSFGYSTTSGSYGTAGTVTGSPVTGTSATAVSTALSSLTPGATYYYQWSAYNSVNGAGSPVTATGSFVTLAAVPGAPTLASGSSSSITVAIATGSNVNTVQYAIKVVGSTTKYVQEDGSLGASAVWRTTTQWGTPVTVTGLSAATTYTVSVAAKNSAGTETEYGTTANVTTASGVQKPSITENAKTITSTTASLPITVNMGGGATTANITLKYSTTDGSYTTSATVSPLTLAANVTAGAVTGTMPSSGSLSAGTAYYYQWTVANSAGSTTATGSFATEPTAGTVTLTAATASSLKVTGKRSDGYGMLMVMKKGSAPTWTPTDGNTYTSVNGNDKALTAGTEVATGEYVVYNGTGGGTASGTGMTISGLDSGSRYYVKIYPYSRVSSAASTYNYNTTSPGSANAYTLSTEPTWSTPSLTATAASASQINLSWGAASGASGYVVVRKNGSSASTQAPSDGTSYSTGSGLGGTIVYVGSATSYNDTSLSAGTTYSYTVWAYNGVSGTAATYNYLTTGSATGTETTFASKPTGAPSLAVSARSTGSITLTVTKGTGASYTLVQINTSDSFTAPTDGTAYTANNTSYTSGSRIDGKGYVVLAGGDGSVEVSGLSSGTSYSFKAYAYNGDGSSVPPNYYATGSTTVSAYTIASEPTWATPSLSAEATSASQIDLSWGAATGASGYLIIRKSGSTATTSEPADGSKYTAKSSETLIWVTSGSTTSKSDTGLSANNTYSYRIYAYKMTSGQDSTYNYLLGTELAKTATASDKTFAAKPTGAPSLSVNTRTVNSLKIDITKGANATYTLLEVYTDGSHFGTPVDGTTYSANAAWGSAGTVGSALAKVVCNDNSTSVTVTGLSAGTRYYFRAYSFNGNGSTTGKQSYYTTSYGSLDTAWTKPNAPTVGATVDGKTMIRLSATKNASGGTTGMVLVYGGSTAPSDGTAPPSKGATWAGGTVIWTGTANASDIEHVVASETAHTYRLFAYAGSSTATAYSAAGTPASAPSTGSFASDEIVDTFSYVKNSDLSGLNGEHGWSGAWAISGTGPTIVSQTGSSIPQFPNYSEYPDNTGNRIKIAMNSDAASFAATREFPQVTSGKIFAAAIMSYHYAGNKKWCRIVLQDGDTAKMGAGRVWESGDDKTIGIDDCNGSRTHGSFELNPWESGVNNDYLVIMRYDFSTKTISAKAYYHGAAVPTEEPTTWDVTKTLSANPSKLNKVSLQAGADSGGYTGDVYFDEVRVATSWTKLLAREATKPAAPTSFSVAADGNEMVRANVAAAAGNVIIVSNQNATFTAPTDGADVPVGTTLGNGKVVYRGPVGDIELVVAAGATPYFGAYAYNADNYYSTMLASTPASLSMGTYPGSCYAAEAFAYTNDTYLTTSTGSQAWMNYGKGWAGAWEVTGVPSSEWSPGQVAQNASGVEGLLETTQLSGAGGNMLALYPGTVVQSANKAALLKRELTTALASGSTWWGMFTMKISTSAAHSWAGMQLIDASGNVKASIGKLWGGTTAGIEGSATGTSTYGVTAGHSYVYIFKWDGSKMWLHVQHVESTSNPDFSSYSTPNFTDTDDTSVSLSMADIKYIQLVAENGRSGDSGTCVGDTWFDEIRIGPSFSALVGGSSTKPAAPGSLTATVDGKEMVRLSWTKNGTGSDVIVVATATTDGTEPADPAAPADGSSYAVGGTVGSTTPSTKVLYKGGATELEHVVAPGTKAKYAVYSDNGDNLYSAAGVSSGLKTTGTYAAGEYVETFSYTNGVRMSASGNTWTGGTACGGNYWGSAAAEEWYSLKPGQVPAGLTCAVANYPESAGNVLCATNLGNNARATASRVAALPYGANGSGENNTMYFAYRMAYRFSGVNKWAGLKIRTYDNDVEYSAFVGKVGDDTEASTLGIVAKAQNGTEYKCWPLVGDGGTKFGLNGLSDSANNTYLIVGKIRWTGTGQADIYANAYCTGGAAPELPENEPDWSSAYWENAKLYGVNSLLLEAGSSDTENKIDYAYFDELRFAGSWDELLAGKAPVAAWMKGITRTVYIGDTTTHYTYSQPAGAKQSAKVLITTTADEPAAADFTSSGIDAEWVRNYDDPDHAGQVDTEWKASAQWTSVGTRYVWGSATGNGTTVNSTGSDPHDKDEYLVQALTAPTEFSAAADGGYRMTLAWTPYTDASDRTFDEVIVLRYASNVSYNEDDANVTLYPRPVDGTTYMAGDTITASGNSRTATVIYRGPGGTYTDTSLSRNTAYYYAVHTVNNGYYSGRRKATGTTADQAAGDPVIDGKGNDWVGVPSATWNSSTLDQGEFIWTDKKADGRHNTDACYSADIGEFRVKANATTVFFLLRLSTAAATADEKTIDLKNTYVSVGVDTRRSTESTGLAWLGDTDDSGTTVLGGDYHGSAAERYAERVMSVHYVEAEDAWRIEMYAGENWYQPPTAGNTTVAADVVNGDYCVEWSVEREDLNLTGAKTARFSVATFANAKQWNGVGGGGTADIDPGKSAAVDAMEIMPYGENDPDANKGSWDEGLKNKEKNNINFWADVPFTAASLGGNNAPGEPTTANGSGPGSPTLGWSQPSDGDGFVTGYLFELSETDSNLSGLGGTTENGSVLWRMNLEGADTTAYQPKTSGTEFWWRVRARDNGGRLSTGTIRHYVVTGKKDNYGPVPDLLYVGTQVEDFLTDPAYRAEVEAEDDALAIVDSVYSEADPDKFGFVLQWTDDTGIYATNKSGQGGYLGTGRYDSLVETVGGQKVYAKDRMDEYTLGSGTGAFAWNILAEKGDGTVFGRVSPNWDLMLVDTNHTATFSEPGSFSSGTRDWKRAPSYKETGDEEVVAGKAYYSYSDARGYEQVANPAGNNPRAQGWYEFMGWTYTKLTQAQYDAQSAADKAATVYCQMLTGDMPNLRTAGINWQWNEHLELPIKKSRKKLITSGWTHVYDKDLPFLPSQVLWDRSLPGDAATDVNANVPCITNFVTEAFSLPAYDPDVSLYLTVSAEDDNSVGADYSDSGWVKWPPDGDQVSYGLYGSDSPESSGSCHDGPSKARNVTTNELILIPVRDDDNAGPVAATNAWWNANDGADFAPAFVPLLSENPSGASSWATLYGGGTVLPRLEGTGQSVTYQLTDAMLGQPLSMLFNVYDQHLSSGLKFGTSEKDTNVGDGTSTLGSRKLTNTAFRARSWNATGSAFTAVESPAANPKTAGYYEKDANGKYVPTEDASPSGGKTYYAWAEAADGWVLSDENRTGFNQTSSRIVRAPQVGDVVHGLGTSNTTVLAWNFGTLTEASLSGMFGVPNILDYIGHHSEGATNIIQLHAWDVDNDRVNDQADAEINFGTLLLTDDDATAPEMVGTAVLGTGTNFVHFGDVAEWTWGKSSTADLRTTPLMSAITVGNTVLGKRASATSTPGVDPAVSPALKWHTTLNVMYHENGMGGDTYRSETAKYFEFTVAGDGTTVWATDMFGFHNRVSATGPTKYALTAQAAGLETTENALVAAGGSLNEGWSLDVGSCATINSKNAIKMVKPESGTVSSTLQSPAYDMSAVTGGTIAYKIGRFGSASGSRTLTLRYKIGDAAPVTIATWTANAATFSDTASKGVWLTGDVAIPAAACSQSGRVTFEWYANSVNGSDGFALYDVSVTLATGDASEVLLGTLELEKNFGDDGGYADTETDVTLSFSRIVRSSTDAVYTFRLYGYGATTMSDSTVTPSSTGTWGINDFYLHGIASEPKGSEVTDYDITTGAWTNRLETLDGPETGYDTTRSGLWVESDGVAGRTQLLPRFSMQYPEDYQAGAEVTSGDYILRTVSTATFDAWEEDFDAAGSWVTAAEATVDTEKGWLKLPANGSASSASRTFDLTSASGVKGLTVGGTLRVKAATASGSGGVNGLTVTVAFLDASGANLVDPPPSETKNTVNAWRNWMLDPVSVTLSGAAKVRVTVAQETSSGTEVDVDSLSLQVSQWGEDIPSTDTAAWAATVENGMGAAKFLVGTPELDLTATEVPLSKELVDEGESATGLYRMVGRVSDYDTDRTDDALTTSVTNTFILYDDDAFAPQWGRMFGGPLGVYLNGTLIPVTKRTGSDRNQKWVVSDHQLAAMGANDPVLFSLSFYDYSGWGTTALTLGSESLQSGGAAQGNYTLVQGVGEAGVPSATNAWSITARNLFNAHRTSFEGTDGTELDMTASVTDLDADRKDDSMAVDSLKVGSVWFVDQDVDAPVFGAQADPYQGVMLATNVTSYEALSAGSDSLALGGSQSAHATGTPASRRFALYDGELRKVGPESLFVVTANLTDPRTHSENGRVVSGLQRGTTATGRDSASLWGTTFEITNTFVAFETATVGSSRTMVASNMVFNETYSDGIGRTRNANQRGNTSWTWNGFSAEDVGTLLPSGYGTAANPSRALYLNIYAYDSDTDRAGDQSKSELAGPQIVMRDDDTTPPGAPGSAVLFKGGEALPVPQTVSQETVPWVNTLSGLSVHFVEATDVDGTGTAGTDGFRDLNVSGIGGYRFASPSTTVTPSAGSALVLGADATDGKKTASLAGIAVPQGWGNYKLFAVDQDNDRDGDALAGTHASVPFGYDYTVPTSLAAENDAHRKCDREYCIASSEDDAVTDPTSEMHLTWEAFGTTMRPDVGSSSVTEGNYTYSPWASYKVYMTVYEPGSDTPSISDPQVYNRVNNFDDRTAAQRESTTGTYVWTCVMSNKTASGEATDIYDGLGDSGTTSILIKDLEPGENYIFAVVGVDKAGNESQFPAYALGDTIKFMVTQSVIRAWAPLETELNAAAFGGPGTFDALHTNGTRGTPTLYWDAKINSEKHHANRGYSLIYRDDSTFREGADVEWAQAGNSISNFYYAEPDGNAMKFERGRMRYYRATYEGREPWVSGTTPLASEEVYALHQVKLSEGRNLVTLHGLPYTNTFRGVFGTDTNYWPAGSNPSDSTRVEFFASVENSDVYQTNETPRVAETYYLCVDKVTISESPLVEEDRAVWYKVGGEAKHDYSDDLQAPGFFKRPFSLTIPTNAANSFFSGTKVMARRTDETSGKLEYEEVRVFDWSPILMVPTNGSGFTATVACGSYTEKKIGPIVVKTPNYKITPVAFVAPVAVHPRDLGLEPVLPTAGVKGFTYNPASPAVSDKISLMVPARKRARFVGETSALGTDDTSISLNAASDIYYDGTDWRWYKGDINADNPVVYGTPINPNDVILIKSCNGSSGSWTWTYSPTNLYEGLPDRHMGR